jgi:predicted SprT family Zn-dependent metalloprotease
MKNRKIVTDRIWEVVELANDIFGIDISKSNLSIDLNMKGNSAGQASIRIPANRSTVTASKLQLKIRLNAVAIEEHLENTLEDTIPHEIAHLVNFYHEYMPNMIRSGKNHDSGWKRTAKLLGCSGQRTHSLELRKNTFDYVLEDGTSIKVGPQQHKKIQQGNMGYVVKPSATESGVRQQVRKTHFNGYKPVNQERVAKTIAASKPKTSKLVQATWIFETYRDLSRKEVVDQIAKKLGLKPTTANSYYQKIKTSKGI